MIGFARATTAVGMVFRKVEIYAGFDRLFLFGRSTNEHVGVGGPMIGVRGWIGF